MEIRSQRKRAIQYSDYILVMNRGKEKFSGFLWDISDSGLGAIFALRDGNTEFLSLDDQITGNVVNDRLGLSMAYEGQVKRKLPLEFEGVTFLQVGIQFQGDLVLPDALYAISRSLE